MTATTDLAYPASFYVNGRNTLVNLTSWALTHNISLTKGKGGRYTVVLPTGYSEEHKLLSDAHTQMFNYLVEEHEKAKGVQTQPTDKEAYTTASTRVNQLANLLPDDELLHSLIRVDSTLAEDEEELGAQLVREADERRALRKNAIETIEFVKGLGVICRGFSTNTPRVSAKIQRKSNKFFALLSETTTPNTRRNPYGMRQKSAA